MIGILDSGVGGLSIYQEVKRRFPSVSVVYLADKDHFPYGEKSAEELYGIVRAAVNNLLDMGVKVLVIACNSATISTITALRAELSIPIIGIEPAVKQAATKTGNNKIGILATAITTEDHESERLAPNSQVYKCHNAALITRIENDNDCITDATLVEALEPMISQGVDSIVLGCTHYHFLKKRMERLYPGIMFYAPEEAVVNRLEAVIKQNNIELTIGDDIFLCSADKLGFEKSLENLLRIINADIREI